MQETDHPGRVGQPAASAPSASPAAETLGVWLLSQTAPRATHTIAVSSRMPAVGLWLHALPLPPSATVWCCWCRSP